MEIILNAVPVLAEQANPEKGACGEARESTTPDASSLKAFCDPKSHSRGGVQTILSGGKLSDRKATAAHQATTGIGHPADNCGEVAQAGNSVQKSLSSGHGGREASVPELARLSTDGQPNPARQFFLGNNHEK